MTFGTPSNMLTERLKARVSSAANPKPFALHSYKRRFHKKSIDCSGKCSIVTTSSETDVVHGVIFDITENQKGDLRKAEGKGYREEEISLFLDGTSQKVFVYIAEADAIDEALIPYRWYYDLVLAGAEQHRLPFDYVAGMKAIPFTQDPKPDRKCRLEALEALERYAESKKRV